MQLRCIVIEDEPLALRKTVSFIQRLNYLALCRTFDNAIEAISYLRENVIDLVFLDIQMEEFSGIQFLESIKQRPKVIITSAYERYALKGYELDVTDYLLKPFTFDRFLHAVEKACTFFAHTAGPVTEFIFVKTENRLEKVNIGQILYIEGKSEYLCIVTDKKIMTLQNFKSLEEVLPKNNFMRVHKSYIVAIDKIDAIEKSRIKIKDVLIPISDTYRDAFLGKIAIIKK